MIFDFEGHPNTHEQSNAGQPIRKVQNLLNIFHRYLSTNPKFITPNSLWEIRKLKINFIFIEVINADFSINPVPYNHS